MKKTVWTNDQDDFLINNFSSMSFLELSKALKKSNSSIQRRATFYGLTKNSITKNKTPAKLKVMYKDQLVTMGSILDVTDFLDTMRIAYYNIRPAILRDGKVTIEIEL